ncbi:unnamed protein product [Paramecium sonneborni]|uniref:Uncharacterized protein n=1 Tax=Paramecium sonneborni TaxID=65129 RepID=A0A8S1NSJ2_9CILI|nr:unnamed protein product [Paramecium sonneborni]
MIFQEAYPFFLIYLGTNIGNQQQGLSDMIQITEERKAQILIILNNMNQKKDFRSFYNKIMIVLKYRLN